MIRKILRASQPEYIYKEATLNPTNPRDRATDWETDLIQQFRNHSDQGQIIGNCQTATSPSLYMARAIKISNPGCLTCHSTPDAAPVSMIDLYGFANAFGWQFDEVDGAQVVSVPMTVANEKGEKTLLTIMGLLVGGFALFAVVLNVMLRHIVITPAIRLSEIADKVSKGNLNAPELNASGSDEISTLGKSFSRMRRSLDKAMKMLED